MKKMIFALVAMVMMTMSANAQRNDNNGIPKPSSRQSTEISIFTAS